MIKVLWLERIDIPRVAIKLTNGCIMYRSLEEFVSIVSLPHQSKYIVQKINPNVFYDDKLAHAFSAIFFQIGEPEQLIEDFDYLWSYCMGEEIYDK